MSSMADRLRLAAAGAAAAGGGGPDANTLLQLSFDGADQSTTIIDDSGRHSPVVVGDAKLSGVSPVFGTGMLGGTYETADYISVPHDAMFNFGTGDFTIEARIYINKWESFNGAESHGIIDKFASSSDRWQWTLKETALEFFSTDGGASIALNASHSLATQAFHTVAMERTGNTFRAYANGTVIGTATDSDTVASNTAALNIGSIFGHVAPTNGFLDELRVSDIARYSGAYTPAGSAFSSDGNTLLLLHFDALTDSSSNGHTVTANGEAAIFASNIAMFGTNHLAPTETSGDYISVPDSADFDLGTNDFTFDFQFLPYIDAVGIGCFMHFETTTKRWGMLRETDGTFTFFSQNGATEVLVTGTDVTVVGVKSHIAIVRSGTSFFIFVDGVDKTISGGTDSSSITAMTNDFRIGWFERGSGAILSANADIDEFRFSDVARWATGFTPPSGPY